MSNQWTLKILSGTHNGAEIPLADGEFSIGAGEHCDLVLKDEGLGSEIGAIKITQDSVTLIPHGADEALALNPHKRFALGGLSLALVPKGETLNEEEIALQNLEGSELSIPIHNDLENLPQRKSKKKFVITGIAAAAVVTAAVAYTFVNRMASLELPKIVEGTPRPRALSDREKILLKSVELSLSLQKITQVEAKIGEKPDTVILTGFMTSEILWAQVKDNLRKDIRGVKTWIDEVQFNSDRVKAVKKLLADKKLDTIHVEGENGAINVMGSVPSEKVQDWNNVVKDYDKTFKNGPPLTAVKATKDQIEVMVINMGDPPNIVTKKGEILMEGAEIEKGVILAEIHEDRLILKKSNVFFTQMIE